MVYDLNLQRIADFPLKPWADRFITLRAALDDTADAGNKNSPAEDTGEGRGVTPTGAPLFPRYFIIHFTIRRVRNERPTRPESPSKAELRFRVQNLRARGMSYPDIARALEISVGSAWKYGQ